MSLLWIILYFYYTEDFLGSVVFQKKEKVDVISTLLNGLFV